VSHELIIVAYELDHKARSIKDRSHNIVSTVWESQQWYSIMSKHTSGISLW